MYGNQRRRLRREKWRERKKTTAERKTNTKTNFSRCSLPADSQTADRSQLPRTRDHGLFDHCAPGSFFNRSWLSFGWNKIKSRLIILLQEREIKSHQNTGHDTGISKDLLVGIFDILTVPMSWSKATVDRYSILLIVWSGRKTVVLISSTLKCREEKLTRKSSDKWTDVSAISTSTAFCS